MSSNTTAPTMAVGWRRNASLKRRHVGDCERGAVIAIAVMRERLAIASTSQRLQWRQRTPPRSTCRARRARLVPHPRIEEHVAQIDEQVDEHVRAGKDQ